MKLFNTIAAAMLLATTSLAGAQAGDLTRLATIPLGAEITGLYITEGGDLFINLQHPSRRNPPPFDTASIGMISSANFYALPTKLAPAPAPDSLDSKQRVRTALGEYRVLAQQGDFAGTIAGGLGAIIAADGSVLKSSNDPDFNGFIPTGDNEGYLFTNWEDRPGGMSRLKLRRDENGQWSVDESDVRMLDFTSVKGTWLNCFGSVSPWGTPLSSEELYLDDTENWIDPEAGRDFEHAESTRHYMGGPTNPYDYGYIVEIADPAGAATPVKHFSMGRFSHENAVVMPDGRTVYLSDDGTDVVFFKFVADTAGDLSAGTLYAAKVTQTAEPGADAGEAAFDVEWIELAHGTNDEIAGWVRAYDGVEHTDDADYISDEEVAAWANGEAADDRVAFLESRKAAKAKGATAEFRKMEGVMASHEAIASGAAPLVYMAMSEVSKGMSDSDGDIQVSENKCGVVYQMPFDDDYSIAKIIPAVAGHGYDKNNAPNACPVGSISNPDNLLVLRDGRVLIGEDTGNHENNMLWVWTPARM